MSSGRAILVLGFLGFFVMGCSVALAHISNETAPSAQPTPVSMEMNVSQNNTSSTFGPLVLQACLIVFILLLAFLVNFVFVWCLFRPYGRSSVLPKLYIFKNHIPNGHVTPMADFPTTLKESCTLENKMDHVVAECSALLVEDY